MKDIKNTTRNLIKSDDTLNICPRCGRKAYAITTEDGMYRVGCIHCGIRNGVGTLMDEDFTEEMKEALRTQWNEACLKSEYSWDVVAELGLHNGSYVLADSKWKYIVHIANDIEEVERYVVEQSETSLDIYLVIEGTLQKMGCSFLVWTLANK